MGVRLLLTGGKEDAEIDVEMLRFGRLVQRPHGEYKANAGYQKSCWGGNYSQVPLWGYEGVKGGVKLDHSGGEKVDQFRGGGSFDLRELRGRLEAIKRWYRNDWIALDNKLRSPLLQ